MTQIEVGSREWQELVSETRTAASTSAWVVGDNALAVAPLDGTKRSSENLREFAEQTEVNLASMQSYRYVAYRWPEDARVGPG
jgi:hypothetical protein